LQKTFLSKFLETWHVQYYVMLLMYVPYVCYQVTSVNHVFMIV
jgi:hypothetical protein